MLFTESYWVVVCAKLHSLLSALFLVGGVVAAIYLLLSAAYMIFTFVYVGSQSPEYPGCVRERRWILRSWWCLLGLATVLLVVSVVVPDPVKTRQYETNLGRPDYAVETI